MPCQSHILALNGFSCGFLGLREDNTAIRNTRWWNTNLPIISVINIDYRIIKAAFFVYFQHVIMSEPCNAYLTKELYL